MENRSQFRIPYSCLWPAHYSSCFTSGRTYHICVDTPANLSKFCIIFTAALESTIILIKNQIKKNEEERGMKRESLCACLGVCSLAHRPTLKLPCAGYLLQRMPCGHLQPGPSSQDTEPTG